MYTSPMCKATMHHRLFTCKQHVNKSDCIKRAIYTFDDLKRP